MPRNPNQKLKLLFLMKLFLERTDESHSLTLREIMDALGEMGVAAERKSLYDDLEALRLFGLDIEKNHRRPCGYYLAGRLFELPELKLLVDAVQSSKFITHKKSNELIKKVESLASIHEARLLQRQVYVANRVKTMNESIYYNIDTIHSAISTCHKISYLYYEWVVDFSGGEKVKKQYRRRGRPYLISPWALTWDNENYYMIGFDSEEQKIKHYRVDKMSGIKVTNQPRDGQEVFEKFDMAVYTRRVFGMFGGTEELVRLRFSNRLVGVVLDRFGKEVFLSPAGTEHFEVSVRVEVSPQFLSWVFGFGEDVKIVSPVSVADQFRQMAQNCLKIYTNSV